MGRVQIASVHRTLSAAIQLEKEKGPSGCAAADGIASARINAYRQSPTGGVIGGPAALLGMRHLIGYCHTMRAVTWL